MLQRETSAYLSEEAEKIRLKLQNISDKKKSIETQLSKIAESKTSLEKEHAQMRKLMAQKSAIQKNLQTQSQETKQKISSNAS